MTSHEFAKLLLAAPAQQLRSLGANERYPQRFDLKGLKVPGVASIGGWCYPEAVTQTATAPAPVQPTKRAKSQKNAPAAPVANSPAPAGKTVSLSELQTLLAGMGLSLSK